MSEQTSRPILNTEFGPNADAFDVEEVTIPKEKLIEEIQRLMALPVENQHPREWRNPNTSKEEAYLLRSATLNALANWNYIAIQEYGKEILGFNRHTLVDYLRFQLKERRDESGNMARDKEGDITLQQVEDVKRVSRIALALLEGKSDEAKTQMGQMLGEINKDTSINKVEIATKG